MILPPPVTNRAGARKPRASGDDPAIKSGADTLWK